MSHIYVVRHGETDWNVENRYLGSSDIPLNDNGVKQAQILRDELADTAIYDIYTSPQSRAALTAEIINEAHNLEVKFDDKLREREMGIFEGLTRKEVKEKYPDIYAQNPTQRFDIAPEGAEMIDSVKQRVYAFLTSLPQTEGISLIVTHGFVARVIYGYFNPEITEKEFFAYTQKVSEYKIYYVE